MIDFSNFSDVQLATMLGKPELQTIHPEILAHLASKATAVVAPTVKKTPKKVTKSRVKTAAKPSTEKEYKVDSDKVEGEINQYVGATSYSAGYLRLKPKNKNGVVILRKADIAALEAFIATNRDRFTD